MIFYTEQTSPLGTLLLAATEDGLCGLYFEEHRYFRGTAAWRRDSGNMHIQHAAVQLNEYFAGKRIAFNVALDLRGTPFQQAVWSVLKTLPFGSTTSYGSIARQMMNEKAVRATGTAIGRNPVSIIVPCHRVLGISGKLSGYAGGLERKQHLLMHEQKIAADVKGATLKTDNAAARR